jgi:hypothetical protein
MLEYAQLSGTYSRMIKKKKKKPLGPGQKGDIYIATLFAVL